jgi:hypothetical protein
MPVKEKLNKSEEVRKLHKSGIKSAAEIMAKLKARSITVAPAQVYAILAGKKGKKKSKKVATNHSSEKSDVIDTAVVFVRQAGGMQKARELLSKLSLLQN